MHRIRLLCSVALVACILGGILGCNQGPTPIPKLHVDSKSASQRVLELHDTDGDEVLTASELAAAPGLQCVVGRVDSDGDSSLNATEMISLIEGWNNKSIGLMTLRCNVTLNKRPLRGANVTLQPEAFLAEQIESSFGLTDEFGDAFLTVPKEKRPIADSPPGVQFGLYRVIISKLKDGKETVPAKYNTATTLGQEVSFDDPGVMNGIRYKLKK